MKQSTKNKVILNLKEYKIKKLEEINRLYLVLLEREEMLKETDNIDFKISLLEDKIEIQEKIRILKYEANNIEEWKN